MDEKKEIVKKLNEKGVFLLKGAVAEVAMRLETSEQTIYRYLK
ncbi:helix-turn-helix domain-containing protein [Yersinia pestis]|nr:helix-turn-helix domain-containing protein [Yersinia pestis]